VKETALITENSGVVEIVGSSGDLSGWKKPSFQGQSGVFHIIPSIDGEEEDR